MVAICGEPLAGKTTFGHAYAQAIGLSAADTSSVIYRRLAGRMGLTVDQVKKLPKEQVRADLVAIGDALCAESPCALVDELVRGGATVIIGIRREAELREAMDTYDLFPIWIENPNNVPPKDNTESAALREICYEFGRVVVNDCSLSSFILLAGQYARLDKPLMGLTRAYCG